MPLSAAFRRYDLSSLNLLFLRLSRALCRRRPGRRGSPILPWQTARRVMPFRPGQAAR